MADTLPPQQSATPAATRFTHQCALCQQPLDHQKANRIVVIAKRTTPLFLYAEVWGECCAPLMYGLDLFRHVRLPKELR